ncbi:DNA-binding protein, partial [Listeria monocytogenes]|nr:DNA-binding protein [Listeria monocytogenes]
MTERVYSVNETFDVLKANKITSNIESVRRWLRQGEIEGVAPTSRKEGWKV